VGSVGRDLGSCSHATVLPVSFQPFSSKSLFTDVCLYRTYMDGRYGCLHFDDARHVKTGCITGEHVT
jgi:hypothetical protein